MKDTTSSQAPRQSLLRLLGGSATPQSQREPGLVVAPSVPAAVASSRRGLHREKLIEILDEAFRIVEEGDNYFDNSPPVVPTGHGQVRQ